jgi:AraC family transcriptional activator of pobA
MKKYQPLVLQKLDIRIPGLHVRQLALHRHLPETTAVEPHNHKFAQSLLYLSGQGAQEIDGRIYPVQTGTAVFLPPGVRHAFRRAANRHPICLVVDFDWRGARSKPAQIAPLPTATLHEIRQQLSRLAHHQRQSPPGSALRISPLILALLDLLLAGPVIPRPGQVEFQSPVARKLHGLLAAPGAAAIPVHKLAEQAGYQHDYLNRLLKRHDGLTLGQMRARKLLARAQELLPPANSIAEVALALGFSDPNYFARWYRKHAGVTPSHGRRSAKC